MRSTVRAAFLILSLLGLVPLGMPLPLFAEEGARRPVQTTSTEHLNFAAGGTVRFKNSKGHLTVEGWDRPEIEIVITKSTQHYYRPTEQDEAKRRLGLTRIIVERHSDKEVEISTTLGRKFGVLVDYEIHVPRDTSLVIHHKGGFVLVNDVSGNIEATDRSGDIMLLLSETGSYAIDARSGMGTVMSDFEATPHVRHLIGEGLVQEGSTAARRIYLRMGFGGITIQKIPPP